MDVNATTYETVGASSNAQLSLTYHNNSQERWQTYFFIPSQAWGDPRMIFLLT